MLWIAAALPIGLSATLAAGCAAPRMGAEAPAQKSAREDASAEASEDSNLDAGGPGDGLDSRPIQSGDDGDDDGEGSAEELLAAFERSEQELQLDAEAAGMATSKLATSSCDTACDALQSMRRASQRLCQLTGEGDSRCQDTQSRLEKAAEAVKNSCPECSL